MREPKHRLEVNKAPFPTVKDVLSNLCCSWSKAPKMQWLPVKGFRKPWQFSIPMKYKRWREGKWVWPILSKPDSCRTPWSCKQKASADHSHCVISKTWLWPFPSSSKASTDHSNWCNLKNLILTIPIFFLLLTCTEFLNTCTHGREIPNSLGLHKTLL